jgi:hypothetical protein
VGGVTPDRAERQLDRASRVAARSLARLSLDLSAKARARHERRLEARARAGNYADALSALTMLEA